MLRPGFTPGSHLEYLKEQHPPELLNGTRSRSNGTGIHVDEIGPFFGERRARGDLDYGRERKSIRRAFTGRKNVKVHAGELLGSTDKIARGRGCKYESFGGDFFAVSRYRADGGAAGFDDAA